MDAGTWGIVAVLVIGTAVVGYGWLSDRAATKRRLELLTSPPERTIPRFGRDQPSPRYLSEARAAVRPDTLPSTQLTEQERGSLAEQLSGAPRVAAGWAAPGFVTDLATNWAVHEHPLILVCADAVSTIRELLPALERAQAADRPLVVVAPDASDPVRATLQANQVQGTRPCLLVRLPSSDRRRSLCSLAGGRLVAGEDLRADWLPVEHLGSCGTWVSDPKTSWLLTLPQALK